MGWLRNKAGMSDAVAASGLLVLAPSCALLLLALPRPVTPKHPPALRLPARQVAAAIARDRDLARAAPGSKTARHLEELLSQKGESEREPTEPVPVYEKRRARFSRTIVKLRNESGERAVLALRARALEKLEAALDLTLSEKQAQSILGSFPVLLQRYGATRDGRIVAPHFVIRTMFKARWNIIHSLEPTYGLSRIERLAHFGWLALHADDAPISLRLQALEQYAAAGGQRVPEARGVLQFLAGDYASAAESFEKARRNRGTLRLRNYALAAQHAAHGLPGEDVN